VTRVRRLSLLTIVAAIGMATLVIGMGVRASAALFSDQETTSATEATAACFVNDAAAPTITASIISKTAPYVGGFIKQGGYYYVYANITGAATRVTADVRPLTSGQFLVPLTAGAYSVGGVAYGWRTASLTAATPLAEGAYTYSVTAGDAANQCRTTSSTVTMDNTAPAPTDIQPVRVGGTAGRPEQNDQMVYTFSEIIDPESVLSSWTGASTNVVVRITDNAGLDAVTIWNAANTVQLPLGSTILNGNFVTTNVTFGASGTASTMVQAGAVTTVTFGTLAGTPRTQPGNQAAVWTPSAAATDRAANASTTTDVTESGANDPNF
jgi:hypothetical protein